MKLVRKLLLAAFLGLFAVLYLIITIRFILNRLDYYTNLVEYLKTASADEVNIPSIITGGVLDIVIFISYIVIFIVSLVSLIKVLTKLKDDDYSYKKAIVIVLLLGIFSIFTQIMHVVDYVVTFGEFKDYFISVAELVFAILLIITSIVTLSLRDEFAKAIAAITCAVILFIYAIYTISKYELQGLSLFRYLMYFFAADLLIAIGVFSIIAIRKEANALAANNNEASISEDKIIETNEEVTNDNQAKPVSTNGQKPVLSFKTATPKERACLIIGLSCTFLGVLFAILICANIGGLIWLLILSLVAFGIGITCYILAFTSFKNRTKDN